MVSTALMLAPFGLVLGLGVVCFVWVRRQVQAARWGCTVIVRPWDRFPRLSGASVPIFDPPRRWLAIRSKSLAAVQSVLERQVGRTRVSGDGAGSAAVPGWFVLPPTQGWVLVVGPHLPEPAEDVDACFRFLMRLSDRLGEVQFFSVNRVLGHHAWARLKEGRVLRAYAWAGEAVWNQGAPSRAEQFLGLRCLDYGTGDERPPFTQLEQARANAEKVPLLAAIWSLHPGTVGQDGWTDVSGLAGDHSPAGLR